MCVWGGGGTGLTLTLVLPIRFKACESCEDHLFNNTVLHGNSNGRNYQRESNRVTVDLQGHRVH